MTLKKQWKTVKENWLIVLVILALILFLGNFSLDSYSSVSSGGQFIAEDYSRGGGAESIYFPGGDDFAPDVETRRITYYASVSVEIDKGDFAEAEDKFENVVKSGNAIVLNRNVNTYEDERRQGYYSLRVPVDNLEPLLDDLKEIGEVTEFSKDASDITGNYIRLEERLRIEQDKLTRLKEFLLEAEDVSDKVQLNEQIANQESTVEYILESLSRQDQRIEYATVSFNLVEEESDFANITFVTFGELVKSFVNSISGLLKLIFVLIPWIVVLGIIWFFVRKFKK
ncbi:DUF4349 domain-containing protein [Candidatus Pacearchaeota archaeon]|nr:DUF4349 domain-containing protein [Candidatus Pacearchaeota archaeon]